MPNWWTAWAERIALALTELWTRSRSEVGEATGETDVAPTTVPEPTLPDTGTDIPTAPDAPPPH